MLTTALIMAGLALYNVPPQRRPRHFRNRDGFSLEFSDEELRARYRFSRQSIMVISDLVRDDLQRGTHRNHALTVEQQVMVTLRFLASGSFLQVVGDTLGKNLIDIIIIFVFIQLFVFTVDIFVANFFLSHHGFNKISF